MVKNRLFEKHVVRYVLAGILSYAVELVCLLILYKILGLSAELSTAIAFWIGLAASFASQKFFAFRDYQKNVKAISRQLGSFAVLVGLNYVFTLAVVALFPSSLVIFSRTLALILVTIWNYTVYKKIIFYPESGRAAPLSKKQLLAVWSRNRGKLLWFAALSVPVLLFFWQYLFSGNRLFIGDFDYYAQAYEAMRISLLHYHQLPLWNPWMAGGLPLFANPQFGLFSIQSIFVLLFGTIIGLKLAYVTYALSGFWGMYFVCRRVLQSSRLRSALVSYIWIFCGFFAGHNISHFTFASFFLLPWLLYFIARRHQKWSWLWLGVIESIIILSSMHYAFLMTALVMLIFSVLSVLRVQIFKDNLLLSWHVTREDVFFVLKTFAVIVVLAGYRLITTYYFVMHNEKSQAMLSEAPNHPVVLFKALFWPVNTFAQTPPKTVWSWGEYSMYIGIGASLALLFCVCSLIYYVFVKHMAFKIKSWRFVACILIVGFIASGIALGNFSVLSPFNLLHSLPGFTQTRVPSRWLVFTMFAILVFLAAWPRDKKVINILLAFSAVELFLISGPPKVIGKPAITLPAANLSNTFNQYDSNRQHPVDNTATVAKHPIYSYYYSTSQNTGQIYADDSLIDTLHYLNTQRCGQNLNPSCSLVLTHNADVTYWSPNKITLKRTAPGPIELNMNVEKGWRVNNVYPFAVITRLDPTLDFVLPNNANNYTLQYAPKLSPSWIVWRLKRL